MILPSLYQTSITSYFFLSAIKLIKARIAWDKEPRTYKIMPHHNMLALNACR